MRKRNIATELTPLLEHVSSLAAARSELEDVRIGCVSWGEKGVASENPPPTVFVYQQAGENLAPSRMGW